MIIEWNRTEAEFPREKCIQELFEEQVAITPELVALEYQGRSFSYRELNQRANQLAHYLGKLGVGPEVKVGICIERSLEMVVGLLAILKAGGAYIPLDHLYPHDRLSYMMKDSDMDILLTQEDVLRRLPPISVRAVCMDKERVEIADENSDNPVTTVLPLNLAYVIYTSGSTGQPKGVEICHLAVVNFLTSMRALLPISPADTLLAQTTLSFDISGLEMYLPLITGARVRIADRVISRDGQGLTEELSKGVTIMQATPTGWSMLLEAGWKGTPGLKILCGGEALTPELAKILLSGGGAIWNLYGPTETTIWSLVDKVAHVEEKVAIGRPIANTSVYILDEQMQPVRVGEVGELWIGGAGLARGYRNQARTTAERFLPDALGGAAGERLYRTGDLACWDANGRVECLGRTDQQVKIRGYRVELGEIEAALRTHHSVRDALVVARDRAGEKQLVGYVVSSASQTQNLSAQGQREEDAANGRVLLDYLRNILPQFMVPSAIVVLPHWPLTLNGKVDRNRLPAPDLEPVKNEYTAPRTALEESVAAIWKEVLGLEKIDVHATFFHLGGHSLMATRMISQVREVFGFQFSLQKVLESPTIAQLSALIETTLGRAEGIPAGSPIPGTCELPLKPVTDEELPLSYSQQRMWLSAQMNPDSTAWNVFIPLRWSGPFSFRAAAQAFSEIIRRHSAFRCTFHLSGGQPIQRVRPYVPVTIQEIDLSGLDKEKRRAEAMRLALEEGGRLFDLEKDVLVRIAHLRLAPNDQILLITTHHIATDLVSVGLFGSEFSLLYPAMCEGRPVFLPELKIQYSDFAYWQREWLSGSTLDYQRAYWQKQLEWAPRKPLLQPDRPRSAKPSMNGKYYPFVLPPELYSGLAALGSNESATMYMTVLAAFKALLYRVSGETDWVVGTDVANRTQPHTESLIGFFVNVLALRTKISPGMTFRQLLRKVRQTALEGYSHQDLPFEEVLKVTGRDGVSSPLFQVFFVVQHETGRFMNIPEVNVSKLAFDNDVSLRELSLYLWAIAGGLHLAWNYRTELFELSTIQRWTKNLLALIENVVRNPDLALEEIDLTSQVPAHTAEKRSFLLAQAKFQAVKPKAVSVGPGNKR